MQELGGRFGTLLATPGLAIEAKDVATLPPCSPKLWLGATADVGTARRRLLSMSLAGFRGSRGQAGHRPWKLTGHRATVIPPSPRLVRNRLQRKVGRKSNRSCSKGEATVSDLF